MADLFSDSLHKSSLYKTTLKSRNRNWGYLLKSRFACTTFPPQKGLLVINLLYLKCTICKKLRFSFFLIQTVIYVFLPIIFLLSYIMTCLDWWLKLQQFCHLPEWPQIPYSDYDYDYYAHYQINFDCVIRFSPLNFPPFLNYRRDMPRLKVEITAILYLPEWPQIPNWLWWLSYYAHYGSPLNIK